jgi:hypothetical protein
MMVHAPGILRIRILVDRRPTVLVREKFLDLPVVRLDSDGELKVLFCDVVPELESK